MKWTEDHNATVHNAPSFMADLEKSMANHPAGNKIPKNYKPSYATWCERCERDTHMCYDCGRSLGHGYTVCLKCIRRFNGT